jgi:NTP pyrophosphatase (non-canonical NTP hydrolase)
MQITAPVIDELKRAQAKFPTWPKDPLHAIAVLGEEYGELVKGVLQLVYEPDRYAHTRDEIRAEAIQVAAMALRFAASIDRYRYDKCEQYLDEIR